MERCSAKSTAPRGQCLRVAVLLSPEVRDGVSVYDEDLTLLRSLSHEECGRVAVSDCGGWVITSSNKEKNARLWDVNTGEAVACVPAEGWWYRVALSRSASVFAVVFAEAENYTVQLYDWSGAALGSVHAAGEVGSMQFTPCGKFTPWWEYVFTDQEMMITKMF